MEFEIYGYLVRNLEQARAVLALAVAKGQLGRQAVALQVIQQIQQQGGVWWLFVN